MIKAQYRSDGWRPDLTGLKVIDIGGANSFAAYTLDAVVDIREPLVKAKHNFVFNSEDPSAWTPVIDHVVKFGKWDYAICTHTLEDLNNPILTAAYIQEIAKRGLIVVPSKFRELSKFNHGGFDIRGFVHHRWIWDILDGKLTAWPKQNFIEVMDLNLPDADFQEELIIEWEGSIDMRYINEGMPYGTAELSGEQHMKYLYLLLKNKNL